jgi:homoserine kinase
VALSGAGPAVLAIVDAQADLDYASGAILAAVNETCEPELILCGFEPRGTARSMPQSTA